MTPKGNAELSKLVAGAGEAEAEPDRHRMEEAVLATVAKAGPDDITLWQDFARLKRSRSGSDFDAVAEGVLTCFLAGIAAHPDMVRDRLPKSKAAMTEAVLLGFLDGSKAVDVTVAREYIKTLAAQDKRRAALDLGREYLAEVEAGDADAAVGGLLKKVCDLAASKGLVTAHPTQAEAAPDFVKELRARKEDGRDYPGLDSGFNHLNEVFNGLTPGVYILAGAPSTGKTSLAKQIADHVAKVEKVPVLFWSFEQSEEELRIKSLARLASVNSRLIWKARLSDKQWADADKADQDYRRESGRWLTVIEGNYRTDTVEAIRAAALMAKHKAGKYANGKDKPVLLVLDYLQILPPPEGERLNGIKDIIDRNLSELRRLSRDLKSPVLVISSENRAAYKPQAGTGKKKGESPKPTLAALKESGGIEYSADAVLCLWRDNAESKRLTKENHDQKTVRVEVHVLKNRNGELAKVELDFTPEWALFTEGKKEDLDWSAAMGEGE